MNRSPDDEYGSLRDLFGDFEDEPSEAGAADDSGDLVLPPGLPPEYVEAYRRGYQRARGGEEPTAAVEVDRARAVSAAARVLEPTNHEPTQQTRPGSGEQPPPACDGSSPGGSDRRPVPWRTLALGALALLLVLGAYGLGRLLADDSAQGSTTAQDGADVGGGGEDEAPTPYDGPVKAVAIAGASATCQTADSRDAAGNSVSYEPAKAHDSDLSTAWRCDGSGAGERFTVALPKGTVIGEVGLVPGYAKTDPASGADRYAENNRITRVRWRFGNGTTFVQRMSGAPGNRTMRTMRVPETRASTVVIQILRSKAGPRDTVAISEIRIASPAG